MNILAIDTSAATVSAALSSGDGTRYIEFDAGLRHSEVLMDMLDTLMAGAALETAALELVACMRGPGSFTGLRIGFAAAKGLALALGIPMISIPTLDCMAAPFAVWPGLVIPAIDAKQRRFFTALYRQGKRISPSMDADPELIRELITTANAAAHEDAAILLTGPDAPLLESRLDIPLAAGRIVVDPVCRRGRARDMLDIAPNYYIAGNMDASSSGPLYLRKSDAELKKAEVIASGDASFIAQSLSEPCISRLVADGFNGIYTQRQLQN